MMNKYRNKPFVKDGEKYDSITEYNRYCDLIVLNACNAIQKLERQKAFEIIPKTATEQRVIYKADFYYIEKGKEVVEDVKSEPTKKDSTYILKRKLFKQRYPNIEFREMIEGRDF